MNFAMWLENEEGLSYLLVGPSQTTQIGEESGHPVSNGIAFYKSPHGSYRYVMYVDGQPVAALQIMYKPKHGPLIANVFTKPEYRRQGLATQLLNHAQKQFKQPIQHAQHLSEPGQRWKDSFYETSGDKPNWNNPTPNERKNQISRIYDDIKSVLANANIPLYDMQIVGGYTTGTHHSKDTDMRPHPPDIDVRIRVPYKYRDLADTLLGNMSWQDAMMEKHGIFIDVHVRHTGDFK